MLRRLGVLAVLGCAFACAAAAAPGNWAAPQIRAVTKVGVLGTSVTAFQPQAALTQAQLADAVGTTDTLQHPPLPAPAAVRKTCSPHTTGDELPRPGSRVFQRRFSVSLHWRGTRVSSA